MDNFKIYFSYREMQDLANWVVWILLGAGVLILFIMPFGWLNQILDDPEVSGRIAFYAWAGLAVYEIIFCFIYTRYYRLLFSLNLEIRKDKFVFLLFNKIPIRQFSHEDIGYLKITKADSSRRTKVFLPFDRKLMEVEWMSGRIKWDTATSKVDLAEELAVEMKVKKYKKPIILMSTDEAKTQEMIDFMRQDYIIN